MLLVFVPRIDVAYPTIFNAQANLVFQWFGEDRQLRFKTLPPENRKDRGDSRMTGYGPHSERSQWRIIYRITSRGWWPTAFLVGMGLATPLPWRRRLVRLGVAVLILDALILARLAMMALALFGASEPVPVAGWVRALDPITESFNSWVPPSASVLLAWAAVAQPSRTVDVRSTGTPLGRLFVRRSAASEERVGNGGPGRAAQEREPDSDGQS